MKEPNATIVTERTGKGMNGNVLTLKSYGSKTHMIQMVVGWNEMPQGGQEILRYSCVSKPYHVVQKFKRGYISLDTAQEELHTYFNEICGYCHDEAWQMGEVIMVQLQKHLKKNYDSHEVTRTVWRKRWK